MSRDLILVQLVSISALGMFGLIQGILFTRLMKLDAVRAQRGEQNFSFEMVIGTLYFAIASVVSIAADASYMVYLADSDAYAITGIIVSFICFPIPVIIHRVKTSTR